MRDRSPGVGALYLVSPSEDGRSPPTVEMSNADFAEIPEIEGRANIGFSYGAVFDASARGFGVARGHFEPHGSVTPHRTRNLYIVVVLRGSGKLVLFGEHDASNEIDFHAGDVIVLPPATLHQWRNGDGPFDFVGIESSETVRG
jgi:oxalate decarboxylase/phosphoglucose isomerase-like protein (cupin superfamily)